MPFCGGHATVEGSYGRSVNMQDRLRLPSALAAALLIAAGSASATEPTGKTTQDVRIGGGDKATGFQFLSPAAGEAFVVREGLGAGPDPKRARRRVSLVNFAQLSDFQLADEESPARVEALDPLGPPVESAHRPQEALIPQMVDQTIRQVNALKESRIAQGNGKKAPLGFAVLTGDNADSQQRNETEWVATLLQGGRLDPNSGSADPADYASCPPGTPGPEEAALYTGFQDYDDWAESTEFYDPDQPLGRYSTWPSYPGLMDAAQKPFVAAGLSVPSYVALGNHDGLVQGNEDAVRPIEDIATGCVKAFSPSQAAAGIGLDLGSLIGTSPEKLALVPPDPRRQYLDKAQYKAAYAKGPNGHGFALVDPKENEASAGAASYYSFTPAKGLRLIALDTVSEGGNVQDSSDGNLDDPQFKWIEEQLKAATAADELVVLFGHHSIQSLTSRTYDEMATACVGADAHGHDGNPGCDRDPRSSQPIHDGVDFTALLHKYPHAIAFVAGHSHINDVVPYPKDGGGGFWNIRTSAEADWPHQQRLVEVMDNRDGTLSIFGTLFDHAGPIEAPPAGSAAAGLAVDQLASIGRTLGYNDPQKGGGTGTGEADDHNVELLIGDPRRSRPVTSVRVSPKAAPGRTVRLTVKVLKRGKPVRGAIVRALGKRARTNRKGIARLKVRVPKGRRITVTARKKGVRGLTVRVKQRR
jgi:metallophosphoesterase (TIGR03767 family)